MELEHLVDRRPLMGATGLGSTSIHDGTVKGTVIEPIKVGERAARWLWAEVLVMQRAVIASLSTDQRRAVVDYLRAARKTTKSAQVVYDEGMALVARCIETNAKAEAA